jgi:hypothetical protein
MDFDVLNEEVSLRKNPKIPQLAWKFELYAGWNNFENSLVALLDKLQKHRQDVIFDQSKEKLMNVVVAIIDEALSRLWNGENENDFYIEGQVQLERYACHAVVRGAMVVLGMDYDSSQAHDETLKITKRIEDRIEYYFTATSYLREKDENFDESTVYAQNFRKQMLLDIRNQLMEEAQG